MTYAQIAAAETPAGVTVTYRKRLSGHASVEQQTLAAPRPTTRRSLYIYLHECGHLHLQHRRTKHSYIEEYEAERWAHEAMRRHGIPVPRRETERAKRYVAYRLKRGLRRGLRTVDNGVLEWLGRFVPAEMAA